MTPKAGTWQRSYLERYYYSRPTWQSPALQWLELLRVYTPPAARVLEIGGGPGLFTARELRNHTKSIVGLDVDDVVRKNPFLDEAHVYDGRTFPFADNSFDMAFSCWVNEHLVEPQRHFAEIARVLAPGGVYVFRTPNLFHYKSIAARIVPRSFHVPLVRWMRQLPAEEHDPYPVYFRANSRRTIKWLLQNNGFRMEKWITHEHFPAYGMAAKPLFLLFMLYERCVNSGETLAGARHTIDCVARVQKAS